MFSQKQGKGKRPKAARRTVVVQTVEKKQPRQRMWKMSKSGQPIPPRSERPTKMVGLAPFARQRMKPMTIRSRDGSSCRIRGTDFFQAVTSGAANVAGDVLISAVVNPALLGVSRLATMSNLYERYKFRSLKFRYDPIANATVSGQLIGYVDYDTQDDPTGIVGVQNLQRAAAHYGEKPVQVWQGSEKPVFWEVKDVDPLTDLYVDADGTDPRWTNQGRFVLLAASALPAATALGNIYLDYDIEFYIPQLELTPITGAAWYETFGGAGSSGNFLGDASTLKVWNNLPIKRALNVYSFPAGAYSIQRYVIGTGLAAPFSCTISSGVKVNDTLTINAATTQAVETGYFWSSIPFTLTLTGTATTVTAGTIMFSLIPRDAVSLTDKKLDKLNRFLALSGGLQELKKLVEQRRTESADVKESKESGTRASSSVSSISIDDGLPFGSPRRSSLESEYTVVRRK